MAKRRFFLPDEPLRHPDHHRPRTRREFISQGFALGAGTVIGSSMLSLFASPARAALSTDLQNALLTCTGGGTPTGMIPFICFDLAGGANFAGSNVLVGKQGGQLDFIGVEGYSRLGLPGDMVPMATPPGGGSFIDQTLGLAFHTDSAILRGIMDSAGTNFTTLGDNTNGAVLPARSENDTGNNPHNPMYALYHAGARGSLVNLIGSQSSDSGGNSMAPPMLIDLSARPTKVDRPTDVTGLVGSSDLPRLLSQTDTVAALEALSRISNRSIDTVAGYRNIADPVTGAKCEILKSVDNTDRFGNTPLDPLLDADLFGPTGVFGNETNNSEYRKAASVMKLVLTGDGSANYAAAGTITMGGYDYHTGDRSTGELRDYRAGRCIGACLEYARRRGTPVMVYVFSDGSVSSNGMIDPSPEARGKPQWTSDNQATACSFFLVYNPNSKPQLVGATPTLQAQHQQIGWFNADGSVNTQSSPAGNSVIQLVDMVMLNYLALHSTTSLDTRLAAALQRPSSAILGGNSTAWERYIAFNPLS